MKFLVILCFLFSSTFIIAQTLDLNSGSNQFTTGEGASRDLSVEALSDYTISSVGINADLLNESFTVNIYPSSNGFDVTGPALASSAAIVGGSGLMFYDIPISLSLTSGNFYVIQWKPTDDGFSDWLGAGGMEYLLDSNLPFDVPPLRMIMGFQNLSVDNTLHPHFRLNFAVQPPAVPTLSQWGLMSLGLIIVIFGVVAIRQRQLQLG